MKRKINLKLFDNINLSIGCNQKNEDVSGIDIENKNKIEAPNLADFVGLDIRDLGQEIIWDLLDGIPLPDNSCLIVWASHIFEHLNAYDLIKVMNECHRILKADGYLEIRSPEIRSSTAYLPQHCQQFTKHYFNYFTTPNIKNYGDEQWEILENQIYHRQGSKYDIRVVMKPIK